MKAKLSVIVFTLLFCLAACESDKPFDDTAKLLPAVVQQDFNQRYEQSDIISFHNFAGGKLEINFTDKQNRLSSAFYLDEKWKLSVTRIEQVVSVPEAVQNGFEKTPYATARIEKIERIERCEFSHVLYRISFKFPRKNMPDVVHEVLMNEDGFLLHVFNYILNDQRWIVGLPDEQLDFIKEHYAGADIRAYLNESGYDTYFFIHNGILKQIAFRDENHWKETRYELAPDTVLPQNIIRWIKENDPSFHYTQVIYIESPTGNAYLLVDGNSADDKGYILGEKIS